MAWERIDIMFQTMTQHPIFTIILLMVMADSLVYIIRTIRGTK